MTLSTSTTSAEPASRQAPVSPRPASTLEQDSNEHASPWRVAAGAALLIGLWHLLSRGQASIVLPGPAATMQALVELARSGQLAQHLGATAARCALGVAAALAIGIPWGIAAGTSRTIEDLGEATLRTLMAVPPILYVVLAMIWLGPGPSAVVVVSVLVGLPLMVITTSGAVRGIDRDLDEMTRVFGFSRGRRLAHLVLPAVGGPVLAGVSVLIGQALRVTVMAELLSASSGVGHAVALSRANLQTETLFAWALVLTVLALALQYALVAPATRWAARRHGND
ncbi:ABC transporter permease [Gephyromycinifex aptenodytis]|uniref:ABC transporter permease n=1 Tax=Gephyromycinifex aptenodytis TaxID=2716227 RepID=UPI00144871B7|nr:ABC transporter permease subunit [Gephyromycinifex aptenodytis]